MSILCRITKVLNGIIEIANGEESDKNVYLNFPSEETCPTVDHHNDIMATFGLDHHIGKLV